MQLNKEVPSILINTHYMCNCKLLIWMGQSPQSKESQEKVHEEREKQFSEDLYADTVISSVSVCKCCVHTVDFNPLTFGLLGEHKKKNIEPASVKHLYPIRNSPKSLATKYYGIALLLTNIVVIFFVGHQLTNKI